MKLDARASAAGVRLVAHEVLGSTNAEALALRGKASAARSGSSADRQTAGRGRRGRAWISQPGNLYASLLLTAAGAGRSTGRSFRSSRRSRSHDAVVEVAPDLKPRLAIKWPNDLVLAGAKFAGILIEGESGGASPSASASIAQATPPAWTIPRPISPPPARRFRRPRLFGALSVKMLGRHRAMERRGGLFDHPHGLARARGRAGRRRARAACRSRAHRPLRGDRPRRQPGAAPARRQDHDHHRGRRVHVAGAVLRQGELIGIHDGAPVRRTCFRAARRGRRDRHESRDLRLRRRAPAAMDRGRSRRGLRRRRAARRRPDPAGHPLSGGAAPQHPRHRAHPRARGSFRRGARSLAAAQAPGLCHAVYRGAAASQARERARRARNPGEHRAARRPVHARPVRHRTRVHGAFDPGIERPHHPHAARRRAAYRRLEDRSDAGHRPADRRSEAARAGRRGLSCADRRFHQCGARGPLAVGNAMLQNASPN